jgi:hypothetical protein
MAKLAVSIAQKKQKLAQLDFQLAKLDQQELELNARLANGGRQLKVDFWKDLNELFLFLAGQFLGCRGQRLWSAHIRRWNGR